MGLGVPLHLRIIEDQGLPWEDGNAISKRQWLVVDSSEPKIMQFIVPQIP